jgi:serine protease inhibitor ecotin
MKKSKILAAVIAGCCVTASAQTTQVKPIEKRVAQKTQTKGVSQKQVEVLNNTSSNTAIAPLILPLPKNEVDTTFLPVIKHNYPKG